MGHPVVSPEQGARDLQVQQGKQDEDDERHGDDCKDDAPGCFNRATPAADRGPEGGIDEIEEDHGKGSGHQDGLADRLEEIRNPVQAEYPLDAVDRIEPLRFECQILERNQNAAGVDDRERQIEQDAQPHDRQDQPCACRKKAENVSRK